MFHSAARSNTGLVRKNNQDSGYAGPNLLLIADGMGGHAGGDVASAITVSRLADLDEPDFGQEALERLRTSILEANERIGNTVVERPELAGMGTTVTAVLRAGDRLALAHIGDSRGFLLRDGDLTQVTADHTFVQMLVDEGRITPEEAENHPQRSVVMKVLGDVGAAPELDLSMREARIGDRWMLCSDGLTGFASHDDIYEALTLIADPGQCCDKLVDLALAGGGADNVTVVIGDVVEATRAGEQELGESVGSVRINPHYALLGRKDRPTELIDTGSQPVIGSDAPTEALPEQEQRRQSTNDAEDGADLAPDTDSGTTETSDAAADSAAGAAAAHTATGSSVAGAGVRSGAGEDDTAEATSAPRTRREAKRARQAAERTAADDSETGAHAADDQPAERPRRRRGLVTGIVVIVVLLGIAAAGLLGWNFVRSQYYVANDDGYVTVYRGVSQKIGPLALSSVDETTDVEVTGLSTYSQRRLDETIPADSRQSADDVVNRLRDESQRNEDSAGMQGGADDGNSTQQPSDPAPTSPAVNKQSHVRPHTTQSSQPAGGSL